MQRPSVQSGRKFAAGIRQASSDFNISICRILKDLGISRTAFYKWVDGLCDPSEASVQAFNAWIFERNREPDNLRSVRQLWVSLIGNGIDCWYRVGKGAFELRTEPDSRRRVFILRGTHKSETLKLYLSVVGVENELVTGSSSDVQGIGRWLVKELGGSGRSETTSQWAAKVNLDRLESGIRRFMNRRKIPNTYANSSPLR